MRSRARNSSMPCKYAQHGPAVARRCFAKLLVHKLTVARQSPYDVTALLDGDLVANPHYMNLTMPDRQAFLTQLADEALKLFGSGGKDADIAYPYHAQISSTTFGPPPMVSALILLRKGDATDRFLGCAVRRMVTSGYNVYEQTAMDELLFGATMRYV
eukprot:7037523-Prymnesium_polylepis.1